MKYVTYWNTNRIRGDCNSAEHYRIITTDINRSMIDIHALIFGIWNVSGAGGRTRISKEQFMGGKTYIVINGNYSYIQSL